MAARDPYSRDIDDGMSWTEYLLFALLFLAIPVACAIVSSVLYYVWKGSQPRRANQINTLGFICFGVQVLLACLYVIAVYVLLKQVAAPK